MFIAAFVATMMGFPPSVALQSGEHRVTPSQLGLPVGSVRTSEPFVTRVYKKDNDGTISPRQPQGYPVTLSSEYRLRDDEACRTHYGIDFIAKDGTREVRSEFSAGVNGTVQRAGTGAWGTISVQLADGSIVQYLHGAAPLVKVGDVVGPETKLGIIGSTGASRPHLHVQALDGDGNVISPDLAFRLGQEQLKSKATPDSPDPSHLEFDPDRYCVVHPEVVDGKVAPARPQSKWISEIVSADGVEQVLGEFFDYTSASKCSVYWHESHPKSLKLTREREVKLK